MKLPCSCILSFVQTTRTLTAAWLHFTTLKKQISFTWDTGVLISP